MKVWASVILVVVYLFIMDGATYAADEAPLEDAQISDSQKLVILKQELEEGSGQQEAVQDTAAQDEPVQEAVQEEQPHPVVEAEAEKPGQEAVQEATAQEEPVQKNTPMEEAQKEGSKKEGPQQEDVRRGDGQKQDLLNRIDELEKRINELTEESRARRKLEITEQEKQEKDKDVLEAVGREYTLDAKHSLGIDYTISYNYSPSERFDSQLVVTEQSDHTIRHILSATYGVLDNLSGNTSIPFVYRYNKVGTDNEINETDIGDISLGVSYQPWKTKVGEVMKTFSLSVVLPTGRSPYELNPETELSTGDGVFSISAGGSFSKQIDPVVAFWNVSYDYNFDATNLKYSVGDNYVLEEVDTGNSWNVGAGLAYALSYKISVNASVNYSYSFSSEYHYKNATSTVKSGDDVSATLGMGMGWKVSNKTTLSFSLGYGLTGSGFSFAVRVPFNFML